MLAVRGHFFGASFDGKACMTIAASSSSSRLGSEKPGSFCVLSRVNLCFLDNFINNVSFAISIDCLRETVLHISTPLLNTIRTIVVMYWYLSLIHI